MTALVQQLGEHDELQLAANFADLPRKTHGSRITSDELAVLWSRMKAAPSGMDEASAMALALEAQEAVRRACP